MEKKRVVLDTNIFVAAAFQPESASGRILQAVRAAELRMVWSDATRRETERILVRIPPIREDVLLDVFRDEDRHAGELHPDRFGSVPDPDDRKFAALASAVDAVLITNDEHLLGAAADGGFEVATPGDFWRSRS